MKAGEKSENKEQNQDYKVELIKDLPEELLYHIVVRRLLVIRLQSMVERKQYIIVVQPMKMSKLTLSLILILSIPVLKDVIIR